MGRIYKRMFPESYAEGRVHQSITISREADDLIREKDIANMSAFINDLIIGSLRTPAYWTKRAMAEFQEAKERLEKLGWRIHVNQMYSPEDITKGDGQDA